MSIQNKFEARTDVDPYEQRHNCMNLALGKPTQSFRDNLPSKRTNGKGYMGSNQLKQDSILSMNSTDINGKTIDTPNENQEIVHLKMM